MIYVFIFFFGAIIGSFLNVVILRYKTNESMVRSDSRCFSCGKKLSWVELVPIFSFFIQKGRCKKCGSAISWQYPIIEAITGIIFVLTAIKIFNSNFLILNDFLILKTVYYWLFFSLLIVISVYDIRHQIIPDNIVYFLIFSSFFWRLFLGRTILGFLAGAGLFVFFWALWLFSKGGWMGLGDAKLALAAGWFLGSINGVIAAFLAFWSGAIFSIFLLLFRGKNFTIKSRIPFGPFIALGTIISFLWGDEILRLYLNISKFI